LAFIVRNRVLQGLVIVPALGYWPAPGEIPPFTLTQNSTPKYAWKRQGFGELEASDQHERILASF
jgi:hypothetical protein